MDDSSIAHLDEEVAEEQEHTAWGSVRSQSDVGRDDFLLRRSSRGVLSWHKDAAVGTDSLRRNDDEKMVAWVVILFEGSTLG